MFGGAPFAAAPLGAQAEAAVDTSATFDGTGGTYLYATCPAALTTYPFWVSVWVRAVHHTDFDTVHCAWSAERTASYGTEGNGTNLIWYRRHLRASAASGAVLAYATSDQSLLPDPYWENILCEYVSATERNVYINSVLDGTSATSITPDLSAGTPQFQIGHRGTGSAQYWKGEIADVVAGAGTLSAGDRTTLATPGADYSTITTADHWWPLNGDGTESIGSADLTASGTVAYTAARPATLAAPTQTQAIYQVFKQNTLPTGDSMTVTAGGTPPVTVTTNLASVEQLIWSFTGMLGAYDGKAWHYLPTTSLDHVVIVNNGHAFATDAATYNMDDLIQQLVAAGYAVVQTFMPGFDVENPDYPGSTTVHNAYWNDLSDTVNPIEQYMRPYCILMDELDGRYTNRSLVGLSGGGWTSIHYGALDSRINRAVVNVRGGIADRRTRATVDFEQWPKPNGWAVEEFPRLIAAHAKAVSIVVHANDATISAQTSETSGKYISAASYTAAFLTPIANDYPAVRIAFYEDQGVATHLFTQDVIDNAIFPALAYNGPPTLSDIKAVNITATTVQGTYDYVF